MSLAMATGQPYNDIKDWEPEAVATALRWLEDKADAEKDARRAANRR